MSEIWLVVGASRGIGLGFVRQLLANGHTVIATARAPPLAPSPAVESGSASKLWPLTGTQNGHNLKILECDVSNEQSIKDFAAQVRRLGRIGNVLEKGVIDCVVLNAGVLEYPNRISEITFKAFAHHLNTNTIGPLLVAQHLLSPPDRPADATLPSRVSGQLCIRTLVFISSDSGSTQNFRSFEDGFGAYAASKAALNQGLRHLAAELYRKAQGQASWIAPCILAIHPGEVMTDMAANASLDWDVEGIISVDESVGCVLKVIKEKGYGGTDEGGQASGKREGKKMEDGEATFWTWDGRQYPW